MGNFIAARLPIVLLTVATLSGCITSDKPLINASTQPVKLLPERLVADDGSSLGVWTRAEDGAYVLQNDGRGDTKMAFFDIGSPNYYLLQYSVSSDGKGTYVYELASLEAGKVVVSDISDQKTLQSVLTANKVNFTLKDGLVAIPDEGSLFAAARAEATSPSVAVVQNISIFAPSAGQSATAAASAATTAPAAAAPSPQVAAEAGGFVASGFTDVDLMQQIYDGSFDQDTAPPAATYAQEFMQMFLNSDGDCHSLVDPAAFMKVTAKAVGDQLQEMPGLTPQPPTHNLDELFQQGWQAGAGSMSRGAFLTSNADTDAQEFYDRYGCSSAIARRFFGNLARWINSY